MFPIFYIFFIFIKHIPYPSPWGQHAAMPRKETKRKKQRKNGSGQKVKPSTPTQAIDEHIGKEEKDQKQQHTLIHPSYPARSELTAEKLGRWGKKSRQRFLR